MNMEYGTTALSLVWSPVSFASFKTHCVDAVNPSWQDSEYSVVSWVVRVLYC